MDINKVIFIGRLGKDPEIRTVGNSNRKLAKVNLATSESYKGQDGQYTDVTDWHDVVIWGKTAEAVEKFAEKGTRMYVEGKLKHRTWDKQDGSKGYATEVVADVIIILDKKQQKPSGQSSQEQGDDDDHSYRPY